MAPVLGVQDTRTARLSTREGYDDDCSPLLSILFKCCRSAAHFVIHITILEFHLWKKINSPSVFTAHRNFTINFEQLIINFDESICFNLDWITSNTHIT